MDETNNYNNFNNDKAVLREDNGGGMNWLWWLIGLLIILGLLWFFFGRGTSQNPNLVDEVTSGPAGELGSGDVEYDENGLPVLGPLAPISNARVEVSESFPVQVALVASGDLPNGCTYLNSPAQVRRGNTFYVNLTTRTEGDTCTEALVPFERRIALDTTGLPAGAYVVDINGQQLSFELSQDNDLNFQAGSDK